MLDNRELSGTRNYKQKRSLQPDQRQSINDSTNDSLLKLMKNAYDMANIADLLNKLCLYLFRKLLKSSEITLFNKIKVELRRPLWSDSIFHEF